MPDLSHAPGWAYNVILAGALLAAVAYIWTKWVHPVIRGLQVVTDLGPVILTIAAEFKSDSGSTLKDTLNRLEETANRNNEAAERAATISAKAATDAAAKAAEAAMLSSTVTAKVITSASKTSAAADARAKEVNVLVQQLVDALRESQQSVPNGSD